ncbi:alpha/beta fold hydrolase [Streptomyces sp. NBC_01261]|uniref:thioesterase II family protein n=1 Tax=Streptomyces sp. NBC_01261 TaxID=2903802 RepID=UPI002E37D342|nr:alpha/beta fold hydrolase [Streptomyces sp. NBC_01261]
MGTNAAANVAAERGVRQAAESGTGGRSCASGRPWIVGRIPATRTRLRLFCLPPAGGSSGSFAPWRLAAVRPDFELATVELPGRGVRAGQQLPPTLEELADAVLDGIAEEFDMPYALFGHSFGALLGYEIAVRAGRRGLNPPAALLVSASRAPHAPVPTRVSRLADQDLLERLNSFGAFPPELSRYPEYLRYALRTVRRDLALVEGYQPTEAVRLGFPLHVFGGAGDPLVGEEQLARWRDCAGGEFTSRRLPGGHDYLFTAAAPMLGALASTLR